MYKIYVICNATGRDASVEASPALAFVKDVFPAFNEVLFSDAAPEDTTGISSDLL